jgi:RHS repeat-associated protein
VITTDYTYDGDGKRVSRTSGTSTNVFVYDAAGNLAAEYSTLASPPQPCATATPVHTTCFWTTDHLGSVRMVTNASGAVVSRHDYLPFGEEIPASIGRSSVANYGIDEKNPQRFTGKERDAESGLDFFGARYMSSAQGRFTSPDPNNPILNAQMITTAGLPSEAARAHMDNFLENPQNWNRYAYVRNNPASIC